MYHKESNKKDVIIKGSTIRKAMNNYIDVITFPRFQIYPGTNIIYLYDLLINSPINIITKRRVLYFGFIKCINKERYKNGAYFIASRNEGKGEEHSTIIHLMETLYYKHLFKDIYKTLNELLIKNNYIIENSNENFKQLKKYELYYFVKNNIVKYPVLTLKKFS